MIVDFEKIQSYLPCSEVFFLQYLLQCDISLEQDHLLLFSVAFRVTVLWQTVDQCSDVLYVC